MRLPPLLLGLLVACTSATSPAETEWAEHRGMEVARSEHPAVVLGDEIVVVGGFVEQSPGRVGVTSTVEVYDPSSDSWSFLPDLPEPRHHLMAAVVDGRLYAIGGYSASGFEPVDTVWELVGDAWFERRNLPAALGAAAAAVVDGLIYVVGGAPTPGLFRYEPTADTWEVLDPPSVLREHLAAVGIDGEVWAIGGRWGSAMHASTEIYDVATEAWRAGPSMLEARSGFGATVVGELIVVAGGEVFSPDRALDSSEWLDPVSAGWRSGPALPEPLHGNPLVVWDDRIYLPGGSTRAAAVVNPGTIYSIGEISGGG